MCGGSGEREIPYGSGYYVDCEVCDGVTQVVEACYSCGGAAVGEIDCAFCGGSGDALTLLDTPATPSTPSVVSAVAPGLTDVPFRHHDGLPTVEFSLGKVPVATSLVTTPDGLALVELTLTGTARVSGTEAPGWVGVDPDGFTMQAEKVMNGFSQGFSITGVGGPAVTIGTTWGNQYMAGDVKNGPGLNQLTFTAQPRGVSVDANSPVGRLAVRGTMGMEVVVTLSPRPTSRSAPITVPDTSEAVTRWLSDNWPYLAAAGFLAAGLTLAVGFPPAAPAIVSAAVVSGGTVVGGGP